MSIKRKIETARDTWRHEGLNGLISLAVRNVPPLTKLLLWLMPVRFKAWNELSFWKGVKSRRGLRPDGYAERFTRPFDIGTDFFAGKRILDIGCGPRGSLEWADEAAERVGLDPLADEYLNLGASRHKMQYVAAPAEKIPFDDDRFDVVASINSLDHVTDVKAAVAEIKRVAKPGAYLLLVTDVNHGPRVCEPQQFSWDIVDAFAPEFEVVRERRLERVEGVAVSVLCGRDFDRSKGDDRAGVLCVMFRKRPPETP
jgi:SAM-dependent methyltransferase